MTLKRLTYIFFVLIVAIWLIGFIPVLTHVWSLDVYCHNGVEDCVPLDSLLTRVQLSNVAALTLTASLTPVVTTLMLIPFCFWFWKQVRKNKAQTNKKS